MRAEISYPVVFPFFRFIRNLVAGHLLAIDTRAHPGLACDWLLFGDVSSWLLTSVDKHLLSFLGKLLKEVILCYISRLV